MRIEILALWIIPNLSRDKHQILATLVTLIHSKHHSLLVLLEAKGGQIALHSLHPLILHPVPANPLHQPPVHLVQHQQVALFNTHPPIL